MALSDARSSHRPAPPIAGSCSLAAAPHHTYMRHRSFPDFPELRTPDLLLRELTPADLDSATDLTFHDGQPSMTAATAARALDAMQQEYRRGTAIHWGLELLSTRAVVGTCGYYRCPEPGCVELGYVLRRHYRGLGLMRQALSAVIAYGWQEMELRLILAFAEPDNRTSHALLHRLGFADTGPDETGLHAYVLHRQ